MNIILWCVKEKNKKKGGRHEQEPAANQLFGAQAFMDYVYAFVSEFCGYLTRASR